MSRYLIEISREYDGRSSERMEQAIRAMGSHFVTHADWRLKDGRCTGSMIAEVASRNEALHIVPPSMRVHARVFEIGAPETVH